MYLAFIPIIIILLVPMTHFVRSQGKKIENDLYAEWGGMPSAIILRERDQTLNQNQKERFKKTLEGHIPNFQFPTLQAELNDPHAAEELYKQASQWLLSNTRDTQLYPLIFAENTHYGFRRNAYASRKIAIGICALCIFYTCTVILADMIQGNTNLLTWGNLTLISLLAITWIVVAKSKWVKEAGFTFAKHLLMACDTKKLGN